MRLDRARRRLVLEPGPVLRRRVTTASSSIFRGVNAELPGVSLNSLYETSDVQLDRLSEIEADRVREGIAYDNLQDAEAKVQDLAARQATEDPIAPAAGG